ncbi:exopolysaccharide transport family protein [Methylocapsa sp. S129]|uniref:GumC family protein n=1 Tax=Methylocapsa sp. S129 TaxID=1641869 RepID=UPI00131D3156|nr:exopolysaccharide transport family protein [Methylocapsa sp. S129]
MEGDWMKEDGAGQPRDGAIDMPQLFRAIARRKWWIILPTLAAFGLALAVVALLPARYTGVAKVLLENQESYYTRPDKAGAEQIPALDPEAVQSQAETITSPDLARQAIAKLDLVNRPEFNKTVSTSPLSLILSTVGLAGSAAGQAGEERIVEAFLSRLTAFPVARTRVLQIEFVSQDPELAARGANVVAQLFLEAQESAKKNSAKAASAWLASKIDELRGKVAETDAKVENYRAQSGLLAGSNNMTVPGQQLVDMNTQLSAARTAQSEALAKAQMMRSLLRDGRLMDAPEFAKDESLRRYGEQRVALKAQIAQESRTLLPGHPRMKELAAQLEGLDAEIRIAVDKAARGLENDARLAAAQVNSLNAALAAQSKTVATGNVDEVQLRALELDAHAARDQLESYVQKYREAIARDADNASPADARVISVASAPRSPTFPKKIETLALGTLAGLLLSTGIVVSQALLTPDSDVARVADLPLAARRREDEEASDRDLERDPGNDEPLAPDALHGDFASVEAVVAHLRAIAEPGVALLTLIAGEGSSGSLPTSLAVARNLSRHGRAILVDLGETQDWFADAFYRDAEVDRGPLGMSELMAGEASFAEVMHRDLSSDLDVIPAGPGDISSDGLDEVLNALVASYAFVVIHASDWRSDLALAAMEHVHKAVVVASASRLHSALPHVREAMGGAAGDVLGFVPASDRPQVDRAA